MSSSDNEVDLMRRALGLRGPAAPSEGSPQPNVGNHGPRHDLERRTRRFVRDGEVPVVVLNRARDPSIPGAAPSNRLVAAESALHAEKSLRERAERSLHEAQEMIQHLQTQLGHANLAHAEALAAERHQREQAERGLAEAIAARAELEQRLLTSLQPHPPEPRYLEPKHPEPKYLEPKHPEPQRRAQSPIPPAPPIVEKTPQITRKRVKVAPVERAERKSQPVKWWLSTGKIKSRKA